MASDLAASLLDDVLGFDDILRKAIDKAFAIAREEEARKAEERRAEEMRELDEFMTQLKDESLRLANAVQDYQSTTSALVAQLSSANKEIEDLKKSLARQAAEAERAKTDIAAMKLLIETEIVGRCSAEADRVRLRDHLNSRLAFRGLGNSPFSFEA
jgi:predicted RNase H-like nuclease (RuvC/YqgF family)